MEWLTAVVLLGFFLVFLYIYMFTAFVTQFRWSAVIINGPHDAAHQDIDRVSDLRSISSRVLCSCLLSACAWRETQASPLSFP